LGCKKKHTNAEQKMAFQDILEETLGEEHEEVIKKIHQNLNARIVAQSELAEPNEAPIVLNKKMLNEVLEESGVPKEVAPKIEATYEKNFKDEEPDAEAVLDKKTIKKNEEIQTKKHMNEIRNYDIVLQTKPEKVEEIRSQVIDGQRCLVIPINENEYATINGNEVTEDGLL
jgi:hypothetical protein